MTPEQESVTEQDGADPLSKFQDAMPEAMALEMIGRYLLDVEGTVRWLGEGA